MMAERTNMLLTGFLTYEEFEDIDPITGESKFSTNSTDLSTSADFLLNHKIAITGFGGRHARTGKEPDAALRPEELTMPTLNVGAHHRLGEC